MLLHCVTACSILPSASMSSSVSFLYYLCQVVHTLFEASADVPHSLDKAYLSVEAGSWKVGWTLQQTGQVLQGDLFRCNPSPPLGYYWLKSASMECREVYCNMDTTPCNIWGGWMGVAYLNMTEPGASCPTSLQQINTPAKLCGRHTAHGSSSVTYPVDSIHYSKVCGQATSSDPLMLSDKLEMILLCLGRVYNSGHYIGCGNYDPRQCQYGQPNIGDEVHSLLITLIECYRQLLPIA